MGTGAVETNLRNQFHGGNVSKGFRDVKFEG